MQTKGATEKFLFKNAGHVNCNFFFFFDTHYTADRNL